MPQDSAKAEPPEYSIIIALVSTEDKNRILECLDALRLQKGDHSYEVIIGDRKHDGISQVLQTDYPEVKLIAADAGTSIPKLRTLALERSRGKYIVVTEDHCVPPDNWLENFTRAFAVVTDNTAAIGGCIENGVTGSSLDWATFLCEYSNYLPPVEEGVTGTLPGMNVAYRREIFAGIDSLVLTAGFWETTLHPELLRRGYTFYSSNNIRLYHSKKFTPGLFLSQRFLYSRHYAGCRFRNEQVLVKFIAGIATILLPALLFCRISSQVWRKRRYGRELLRAYPYLLMFIVSWATGEMWGYFFGPGHALEKIE